MTPRRSPLTRALALIPGLSLALVDLPVRAQGADTSTAPPPAVGRPSGIGGGELVGDEGGRGSNQLGTPGPVPHNSCRKAPPGARFTVTLPKETELEDLVNWMMTVTCQKFIWDRKVRSGKVTILSPEPVTVDEAYAAFYAALETMGLTVEPSGRYFKIVETTDAKNRTLPLYDEDENSPNSDRFVTQLIRIKNGQTKEIGDVLDSLKSKQGSVDIIGSLIILTDKGSSIRRLEKIVAELDTPMASEKIFFYQLQYAKAEEVAQIIRDIFGDGAKGGGGEAAGKGKKGAAAATQGAINRVIVDERSGTLIIITSEGDYAIIRRLIERLDVKLPGGGGRIHVRKLKNADAQEVAQVLSALATGAKQAATSGTDKNKAPSGPVSADLFSGDVKITPDQATRSLVIIASQADYKNLEPVIDKLDMERRQLYIEIYMLEVSIKHTTDTGAGAHFGIPFNVQGQTAVGILGSAPTPALNSLILSPDALKGLAGGLVGPLVSGTGQLLGTGRDIPGFGAVIQALQSNSDVNVISEPHMYAADNQEATIEVGRNVPTPGALSFSAGGGSGLVPLQSVERQDVTLRIKVKPYINDERNVTMDVEVEDRDITDSHPTLGVTTTKRRLKLDKIVGRDSQPVVLGGLIRDRESETVNQVPGLGQIPLLGWLFKSRSKAKEKVNLMLVLIPHIIDSPDDVRRIHERRDKERLEFIERETNFRKRELPNNVNYRKKGGILAAIDKEARRMEQEEALLRRAEEEMRREVITGVLGMSPRIGPGEDDDGGSSATMSVQPAVSPPSPPAVRRENPP